MATRTSSDKRFVGHCNTRALHKRYEPFYITELSSSKQREIPSLGVRVPLVNKNENVSLDSVSEKAHLKFWKVKFSFTR